MNSKLSSRQLGIFQVLLSGICFGFLGVFGRWAYSENVHPQELLGFRFLLASLLLGLYLWLRHGPRFLRLSKMTWIHCSVLGLFGYAVFSSFYFFAIQKLSITLAVLLLYTFPFWVLLGGFLFQRERLRLTQTLIFPIAFLGLLLLIGLDLGGFDLLGLILGTLSAMTYAAYILLSRKWLDTIDPLVSVFYIQLAAGVGLFFVSFESLPRSQFVLSAAWVSILGLAVVCSVGAMTLFQAGLQKIKSWEASLLSTTEPLASIALALLLFGESLQWQQWLGAGLLICSFVAISLF